MKSLLKLSLLSAFLLILWLVSAYPAYAEARQVYTGTIGLQQTDWTGSMSFPRFNPNIGILKGVEFALDGRLQGRAEFESLDAQPNIVTVGMSANVQLQRPNGSQILQAVPNASVEAPVEAFDQEIDFAGPSGHIFPQLIGIDIVESGAFSDPTDLVLFTGAEGNIVLPLVAMGAANGQGGGNLALNYVTQVSAFVTVTYLYEDTSIDLEKFTNGEDADDAPGVLLSPGDPVVWTYIITNTGGVALEELSVLDDQEGAISCPTTTLAAGASMICTLVSSNGALPLQYSNLATVTAKTHDDGVNPRRTVTDSDPSNYSATQIDLEKFTNGEDADDAPGVLLSPGDPITWTYIITNTSAIDLVELSLLDDQEGTITCPASTLAAGASMICTLVSADGAQPLQYTNVATVTAKTHDDGVNPRRTVTDSDPSNYLASPMALCPVDNQGVVSLPTIVFMGMGPGTYVLPDGFDAFIIKRRAFVGLPFKFDTEPGVPTGDGHRVLVINQGPGAGKQRVWACGGGCNFIAHLDGAVDMGFLPEGVTIGAVVIDDDTDDRINRWVADDGTEITEFLIEEQTMVEYLTLVVPKSANWSYYAVDSVGIVDLCLLPPNAVWPLSQVSNGSAPPNDEEAADARVLLPWIYSNRR